MLNLDGPISHSQLSREWKYKHAEILGPYNMLIDNSERYTIGVWGGCF
jgi:hypothetical protein